MRPGGLNDSVARAAQRWIDAQDDLVIRGGSAQLSAEDRGRDCFPAAAQTLLHLLKLPRRNAHGPDSARVSPGNSNAQISPEPSQEVADLRQAVRISLLKPASTIGAGDVQGALEQALKHQRSGQWGQASELCDQVLAREPENFEALHLRGLSALNSNDASGAVRFLERAAALKPNNPTILLNLGNALAASGDFPKAVSVYREALEVEPQAPDTLFNLALATNQIGDRTGAIACLEKALSCKADFLEAHFHLGCLLWEQRRVEDAIAAYRRARDGGANFREMHANLGVALQEAGRFEEAASAYCRALEFKSDVVEVRLNLALAHEQSGLTAEAIREYDATLQSAPNHWMARWGRTFALPIVYEDEKEIDTCEARWSEGLACLLHEIKSKPMADADQALALLSWKTNFYLHYQGRDHTRLQGQYGELLSALAAIACPGLTKPIPKRRLGAQDKLRIAFVSSHFRHHTILKLFEGWLRELDRSRFEVHAVSLVGNVDSRAPDASLHCRTHDLGALPVRRLVEWMQDAAFDIIVYLDIGIHFRTQPLAALRLAPVQCGTWGHPVTSGLSAIDYFLSSELMEPENAAAHYSEKLVRLPSLSICYAHPELPAADRQVRPTGGPLSYFCSQSLFKLLPQFDSVYPRIAAKVRGAKFWFIGHHSAAVTEKFRNRLRRAFAKLNLNADEHVAFYPRMSEAEFFQATQRAAIVLDSILWSGGNSSLEALACDKPMVTLPGPMLRGRHTYAILRRAGLDELIAGDVDEYVEIAVRLGRDANWRAMLGEKIRAQKMAVFNDLAPVRALENFVATVGQTAHGVSASSAIG
ncbi:MAG: tetratricopeptide repeat protein [Verrucomicrobia bacterium]|nr:tetratricopeptide repeat protein [Verrucomicrobiota bacterium]